jgi:eukaryotic-like serine/threonine-protein kinase
MTPERWQIVKELLAQASLLRTAERDRYLAEACANDAELRDEVGSLLAADHCADAILDQPLERFVAADAIGGPPDRWLGTRIGAYELVARLGSGGMGEVYRARRADTQFEKDVAIKLVRRGYDSQLVLQRFGAERQILADLDHPNIARLLDAGVSESGEPYLVMELVDGEPIDRYCESRRLPIPERLRLFREVCAAVSHAHQHLVVHRDLKPANILVTARGTIKLLDFGIAKLLQAPAAGGDVADATQTMFRAMTPAFSSPEQLLGLRITTASDVYSLGVVLYHLLAGRSPYRSTLASTHDAIKDVCETEPAKPSVAAAQTAADGAARPLPDRDLDDITLRALRKEPDKRYSSVEQLSGDLGRYLAGLPVLARGDRIAYRAAKFARRHRVLIAAVTMVAAALMTGLVVSIREARIAEHERALAARHFDSVRSLASTLMFQVHDAIRDLPGATAARSLLLTTAVQYLDALAKEPGADRTLQRELAESYQRVADIQGQPNASNTGHAEAALANYAKAISLLEPLRATEPTNRSLGTALVIAHLKRSRVYLMFSGDGTAGATESQRAATLAGDLSAADPADADARSTLVLAYRVHAYNASLAGQHQEAVAAADKAITVAEQLQRDRPGDVATERLLADAYGDRTAILPPTASGPDIEQNLALARKALAIDERLIKAESSPAVAHWRSVAVDWGHIAILLFEKRDYAGALAAFRAAQALVAKTLVDAHDTQAQVDMARLRMNLGRTLAVVGRLAEARELLQNDIALLNDIMRTNDTQEMQFLVAVCEEELGTIESRLAEQAGADRTARLHHWSAAAGWFERSAPRFRRIIAGVTLNAFDRPPVDRAFEGLARSHAEIDRLGGEAIAQP